MSERVDFGSSAQSVSPLRPDQQYLPIVRPIEARYGWRDLFGEPFAGFDDQAAVMKSVDP